VFIISYAYSRIIEHFPFGGGGYVVATKLLGPAFVITSLFSEAALLVVAAQAGFIDGPRVMANMASDSWLPHRFAALSDRLTTQNGVVLMGLSALAALWYTKGSVSALVVMYSINVFATFSLSEMGMVRFWITHRKEHKDWARHLPVHATGLTLCFTILCITVSEKFLEGGWLTLLITAALIGLCILIHRHYGRVRNALAHLDALFADVPIGGRREELGPCDPTKPTAALFVADYGGMGIHSLFTVLRTFPDRFQNIIFISVGIVDSGNFKGADEIGALRIHVRKYLGRYVGFARQLGVAASFRDALGTDVVEETTKLALEVAREFPQTVFFGSKLIFEEPKGYHRFLHNETALAIQYRLQFAGHPMMVLPVRVRARELKQAPLRAV
jgi:hypothetical protein